MITYKFYLPENNPSNLTDVVGGAITTSEVQVGNGLFVKMDAYPPDSGLTKYQYRKIFIKNTGDEVATSSKVWLMMTEHSDQIALATGDSTDYIANAETEPSGSPSWVSPTTYSGGLSLGNIAVNGSASIWIRIALTAIYESDMFATFSLSVAGLEA